MRHSSQYFADSYAHARRQFRAAAEKRNLTVETHVLPDCRGVAGEELATEVVHIGAPDAARLLIISSATHGVEGYCGSGCQVAMLYDEDLLNRIASADVSVLLIHAINPHGFSYWRRVNEDNVDVNRNFIDFGQQLPESADYKSLEQYLLPTSWPPTAAEETALSEMGQRLGTARFGSAVGGGQYVSPDGMYYGGSAPTWSNRTARKILRQHGKSASHLGWIDLHTGLGPPGHCEKVFIADSSQLERARSWWGADVFSTAQGESVLYEIEGPLLTIAEVECPQASATTIALEYGTVPFDEMVMSLRGDHWLYRNPDADPAQAMSLRERLLRAFYLNDNEWKASVLAQYRVAVLQAVEGLRQG